MPSYEYRCKCGNEFEKYKPFILSGEPELCMDCGELVYKSFSIPYIIADTCSIYNHSLNKTFDSKSKMEKEASAKGFVGLTTSGGRSMASQLKEIKDVKAKEKKKEKRAKLHKHFEKACKECYALKDV